MLYEKHVVICKQANPHSVSFRTCSTPRLVMFRYENSSTSKLIKDAPSKDVRLKPLKQQRKLYFECLVRLKRWLGNVKTLNVR